jgi:hypothetical protein
MDRRDVGIVATLVASLLCGLPGLVCLCISLSLAVMYQDPTWQSESGGNVSARTGFTMGLIGSCMGILLISIPVIIAIVYFRRRTPNSVLAIDEPLPPPS